jgi:hypothetical protein
MREAATELPCEDEFRPPSSQMNKGRGPAIRNRAPMKIKVQANDGPRQLGPLVPHAGHTR